MDDQGMDIREFFTINLQHLKIDRRLINSLHKFQVGFINKNNNHAVFFGGMLLGTVPVEFQDRDVLKFFSMINVDETFLRREAKGVPGIVLAYKVTGDILNHVLVFLAHRILTDPKLNDKQKNQGARDCLLILNYRTIAALISSRFKYNTPENIAKSAMEAMSDRFILKQVGSWQAYMDYRVDAILDPKSSIHYKNIIKYDSDDSINYIISDSHARINGTVKEVYELIDNASSNTNNIVTNNPVFNVDGEETLKDITNTLTNKMDNFISLSSIPDKFIISDIMDVVMDMTVLVTRENLKETLEFVSLNSTGDNKKSTEPFFREVLIFSYGYLFDTKVLPDHSHDLGTILVKLKGIITSSRSSSKELKDIRSKAEKYVKVATKKSDKQAIKSIRTALLLYIFIRSYIK